MHIIDNLTKEEYQKFFDNCPYNHFLQSKEWGEVAKERKQTPIYLALVDDNNKIHAACLAMRKHVPVINKYYYYSPRGILIDYNNRELLEEFTKCLKDYLKKNRAIYFKFDPAIVYQSIDEEANPIDDGNNNYELYNKLVSLGYVHRGFTKLFTLNQPRFTFRINTQRPLEEIENSMNKTYLKTIKRSYNYDLEVCNDYDNDTFYKLMCDIANKDNFNGNSKTFYERFDENFSKSNNVLYITIKIYPDKILKKAQDELDVINDDLKNNRIPKKKMADTENVINRLNKDIDTFMPYKDKYPDGIVSLILICPKIGNKMWTLYIGNNELATYTFSVNRAYYEAIKYAQEHNYEFLDLFGTCGDPHTKEKNYVGIHEYKRKMGGTYTEFIGEFDLITDKFWYKALPTIIKLYRKIKKSHR